MTLIKNSSINFQSFYKQLETYGLNWKTMHFNYTIQLSNDEKVIEKPYSWCEINLGIKDIYENCNSIVILNTNKVYKFINWTDLCEYHKIVKHKALKKYFLVAWSGKF